MDEIDELGNSVSFAIDNLTTSSRGLLCHLNQKLIEMTSASSRDKKVVKAYQSTKAIAKLYEFEVEK